MNRVLILFVLLSSSAVLAEDVMLESFDDLSPEALMARTSVVGGNLRVELVKTQERAGVQNLQITGDLDPADPNWNHIRLNFVRRVRHPQSLTFWYRGDRTARLYLIVEDSTGTRTDVTIGEDAAVGVWQQATIRLVNMHVPNGIPPNDTATPVDVAALEVYPYPAHYPGPGRYVFQLDDISVTRPEPEALDMPLETLTQSVRNGGFEQVTPDGTGFVDWSFGVSGGAEVSLSVSTDVRHAGQACALLQDRSPTWPHVYGRLVQRVPVLPATGYRLSCWVKGQGVGVGSHWTDWKTYMLRIPSGDFEWREVSTRFVTGENQTALELGLNVVNVTEALWVDDVRLEPDLTPGQGLRAGAQMALWCPEQVVADSEELPVRLVWQGMPEGAGKVRVELLAGDQSVADLTREWREAAGVLDLTLQPPLSASRQHRLVVTMTDETGEVVGRASREVDVLSSTFARTRWEVAQRRLADLDKEMERWREMGLPLDYPTVTRTVVANFLPWIEEDIARGEIPRACRQLDEVDEVLSAAIAQCQASPAASVVTVPRYRTGHITIQGGHFVGDVEWPDGRRERRPVFFNGYGHFGAVRRDVELFPAYGLNIIQVEFGPNSTVLPDFAIDPGACEEFERVLERAESAHVAVNLLLSPHSAPQWARERWPELGGINGGFITYDVDHPQARAVLETFLTFVAQRLRNRPGLHSFCLSNEPVYIDARSSAYNTALWHRWLVQRHGTVEALNQAWGTAYAAIQDVPVPPPGDLTPRPELYDWVSFNNERFAAWHRWMADVIHAQFPDAKLHAKIMMMPFARDCVTYGNDVELFCDLSQIAGNDAYNYYIHDPDDLWGNTWQSEYQYYDLLRSMRGQPVFNSENHVVADRNWERVPGAHMRNLIWQGAIHGLGASTTWVWERTYDNRSDFAGSIMHRPALCDAHGRTALDLLRLAPEVVAIQDAPARVAVVYSICSLVWNPEYSYSVGAVYRALTFLGEKVDFITHRQLATGGAGRYQVIVVPSVTHLEEEAYRGLAEFARSFGRRAVLVGDGCLSRDEYGRPRDVSGLVSVEIPLGDEHELRDALARTLGLEYPVRVVDPDSGELVWGVGWRWAKEETRYLINLCNYMRKPVSVRVEVEGGGAATNLMNLSEVGPTLRLEGMEPALLEVRIEQSQPRTRAHNALT